MEDYKYPNSMKSLPVVPEKGRAQSAVSRPTHVQPIDAAPEQAKPLAVEDPASSIQKKLLEGKIIETLRTVYDPEIPVNIHDLGLIYEIHISDDRKVLIKMTLTAPGCPVAGDLVAEVHRKVQAIDEVKEAEVQLVWDPPWTKDRMSETAMLELGL